MRIPPVTLALARRYAPRFLAHPWRRARGWVRQARKRRVGAGPLFLFGGHGEIRPGAGWELYAREPAFRAVVRECDHLLRERGSASVLGGFEGGPVPPREGGEAVFTVVLQLALVELWRAHGVEPQALLGLSLGEAAAVYAAGGLDLAGAVAVGLLWEQAGRLEPAAWGLLAVEANPARAGDLAARSPAELFLVSAPGERQSLWLCPLLAKPAVREYLAGEGIACHAVETGPLPPYHTVRFARHEEELRALLRTVRPQPLARPCYLGSLGRLVPVGTVPGSDFWLDALQYPVLGHAARQAALLDGYELHMPVGPEPFGFFCGHPEPPAEGASPPPPAPAQAVTEWGTFAATRQKLVALGLVRSQPPPRPAMGVPAFLAQFAPQTCLFIGHPAASFAFLRQAGDVHFLPLEQRWLVLEAKLINNVLGAPETFASRINVDINPELIGADPPDHTAVRGLFQPFFAPTALRALGHYVETTIADLAADKAGRETFDFVTEFAMPLTWAVSERLLGLSASEARTLHSRLPGPLYSFQYFEELQRFLGAIIQERQPSDPPTMLDQLAELVRTGPFTLQNASSLGKLMWEAGVITTSILISSVARYLLTHPAIAAQLRSQPELIEIFVEEMLRLDPPLNTFLRVTTQPVTLGEHALPAGATVICCITSANRDPERYLRPDDLDLHRAPQRHMTFSGGIHACMGALLARLEARLVIQWLLAQGSALRLAEPFARAQYFPANNLRAIATLPVRFQPAAAHEFRR